MKWYLVVKWGGSLRWVPSTGGFVVLSLRFTVDRGCLGHSLRAAALEARDPECKESLGMLKKIQKDIR